jgi:hypothetical protein
MTIDLKSKLAGDKLFFISYGLFLITSILSTSFFYQYFQGVPYMWMQIIGTALLVAYECLNGLKKQEWKGLIVCLVMELISWRVSPSCTQRQVVLMFWYIYCARNIPFAKIARFTLNVSIILVLTVVSFSCFGLVESITAFKSGRVREYLGFRYALYLPGLLLNMTALWVWLKKDTVTVWGCLIWAVANWVVYYFTDSRISFFIAEALLAAALFMRYCPKVTDKLKPLWWLAVGSFLICAVVSIILTVKYDSAIPWMRKLNSMLESRLRLGHVSMLENGYYFFGQRITWLGNGLDAFGNSAVGTYTYVDCLYVKILQRYGIVFLMMLIVFSTWSMIRLYKRKEYHIILICATVAVHSVLDDLSFSVHYNTFWLAMGMVMMNAATLNWNGKTTQIETSTEEI